MPIVILAQGADVKKVKHYGRHDVAEDEELLVGPTEPVEEARQPYQLKWGEKDQLVRPCSRLLMKLCCA